VLGHDFNDLLRERPARRHRLLLKPKQALEVLRQPIALLNTAGLRRASRDADQPRLLAYSDGGVGRAIAHHLQDPLHPLLRGLVRHPGASVRRWGQHVPSVPVKRGLALVEMAAADASNLASQADVLKLVGW
jgi:hypothetical protein